MGENIKDEDFGEELINAGFNTLDINKLDKESILEEKVFITIFNTTNSLERTKLIINLQKKAKELGILRNFDRLLKAYQQDYVQKQKVKNSDVIKVTNPPIENLKCGAWQVDDLGVYKNKIINFEPIKIIACSHPIIPTERLINVDQNTEKIKLAFYKDNKWQYVIVDRSIVANKTKIVNLSDRGIEVTSENAKELVNYISEIVSLNVDKIPCYKGINRLGWTEYGFSPYVEEIKYDGELENKTAYEAVTQVGDFEKWKEHCIKIREKSKISHIMLASSFASPLIKILGMNCYCVHLWGGTGTGKTVGLMLAMSVWGNPNIGKLISSTNCTKVFLERISGFHHDIPVALDELQIIKSKFVSYDELIMMLTEGVNRGRGKAVGGTEDKIEWNCNFLFTGEEPITQQNSGGGAKNRVLEIEAVEKLVEDGNYTANLLRENYGFAGKMFVNNLPSKEELRETHKELQKEILEKFDTTEKQAMPIASILLADKISTDLIFKDSNYLTIEDFKEYIKSAGDVDISERAYDFLHDWIAQNENKFKKDTNTELYGIMDYNKNQCCILKKIFDEALELNNFSSKAIISKFVEKGYIQRDVQGKYTRVKKINGVCVRVVELHLKIETRNENIREEEPF